MKLFSIFIKCLELLYSIYILLPSLSQAFIYNVNELFCTYLVYGNTPNIDTFYVQIENHSLNFQARAQSKCGTFDYLNHIPLGGDKKVLWICIPMMVEILDVVYLY